MLILPASVVLGFFLVVVVRVIVLTPSVCWCVLPALLPVPVLLLSASLHALPVRAGGLAPGHFWVCG